MAGRGESARESIAWPQCRGQGISSRLTHFYAQQRIDPAVAETKTAEPAKEWKQSSMTVPKLDGLYECINGAPAAHILAPAKLVERAPLPSGQQHYCMPTGWESSTAR